MAFSRAGEGGGGAYRTLHRKSHLPVTTFSVFNNIFTGCGVLWGVCGILSNPGDRV